jgi:hypothetical protein
VRIRHSDPSQSAPLHLAEVSLYDSTGVRIPISSLRAVISSVNNSVVQAGSDPPTPGAAASQCIDDNLRTLCATSTADPDPQLIIAYPCNLGLSRVMVVNHATRAEAPYVMDFALTATGLGTYYFNSPKPLFHFAGASLSKCALLQPDCMILLQACGDLLEVHVRIPAVTIRGALKGTGSCFALESCVMHAYMSHTAVCLPALWGTHYMTCT